MNLKNTLKQATFDTFLLLDQVGVHLLPKHFYSPVADFQWLSRNKPAWARRASLTGVHWDLQEQLDWLEATCAPYYSEVAGLKSYQEIAASGVGSGYGPIESQVLHGFIRSANPARIVEIGSGVSTAIMLRAVDLNVREGRPRPQIICVEPHPKAAFRQIESITHIEELCQTVPHEVFAQLEADDFLFIDSSHALKLGSDVLRIYLDILPRLKPGITIQIHDVYLPYLYSPDVLGNFFGWQETPLLLALLTNNDQLSVLACLSALHNDRPDDLARFLTDYQPIPLVDGLFTSRDPLGHYPASIWLKTA